MSLGDWYLNGTKLCPWNFKYAETQEVIGEDARLLDGSLRRDIAARKLTVDMSWEYLPEEFDGTYHAYKDLRAFGTSSGSYTYIRPVGTGTGTEQYSVLCSVPTGELALRADGTNVYWNVGFNVRQV